MWIGRCQLEAAAVRPVHAKKGALVFADCGLVVDPDTAELADIAVTSLRLKRRSRPQQPNEPPPDKLEHIPHEAIRRAIRGNRPSG